MTSQTAQKATGLALDALRELARTQPELSLAEAARQVGVSRQRAHQLARKHDLPFPHRKTVRLFADVPAGEQLDETAARQWAGERYNGRGELGRFKRSLAQSTDGRCAAAVRDTVLSGPPNYRWRRCYDRAHTDGLCTNHTYLQATGHGCSKPKANREVQRKDVIDYGAVLRDLEDRRDKLNSAIELIRRLLA